MFLRRGLFCRLEPVLVAVVALSASKVAAKMDYSLDWARGYYISGDKPYFRSDQVPADDSTLGFNIDLRDESSYKFEAKYFYSLSEEQHYFNVPNFYYRYEFNGHHSLTLGRREFNWSQGDELWQRGLWQPRFFWNKLRPENQGLFGLHYDYRGKKNRVKLLVSPYFIPELGPEFEIDSNENFYSANPWFRPPPKAINMFGQDVSNHYSIDLPETIDVIENPVVAMSWWHHFSDYFVRASVAWKPMNQLLLASPAVFDQPSGRIDVKIKPQVIYHNLATLEWGKVGGAGWSYWLSLTKDEPHPHEKDPVWITQQVETAWVTTGTMSRLTQWGGQAGELFLSASQVNGGDTRDGGLYALENSYYERRFQFTSSLLMGWHPDNFGQTEAIQWGTRLLYDIDQQGGFIKLDIATTIREKWRWRLNLDILGLVSEKENEDFNNGFIQNYRANDKVELGVQYVF